MTKPSSRNAVSSGLKKDTIDSDQLKTKVGSCSLNDDQQNGSMNSSAATANNYQNQPFKCLANSIEPRFLLSIIVDRLESHKKVDINASTTMGTAAAAQQSAGTTQAQTQSAVGQSGSSSSKVKCVPSARTINCPHHCVAILATRLFAILCNEPAFQQKLVSNENSEACFNMIIEILYPNNDPVTGLLSLLY